MDVSDNMSETAAIAELAVRANGATTIKTEDGRQFLILPDGFEHHDVSDPHGLKGAGRYIAQAVTLEAVDSLVDYVNRYRTADTVLFANIAANAITAVIDYHPAMSDDGRMQQRVAAAGGFVAHKATMTLPFSEEWRLWTGISGRLQSQLDFARFLEENGADVRAPDAAELLEACRDLQAHRKVNFTKAVRTHSDNENFEFTDETETRSRGGIELPTKFILGLPVYFGEPETELQAFLRCKLNPDEGGLQLGVQLHRAEHVRQAVFKQIMSDVGERTGCPVVFGKVG